MTIKRKRGRPKGQKNPPSATNVGRPNGLFKKSSYTRQELALLGLQSPEFFASILGFDLPPHQVQWLELAMRHNRLLVLSPADHGKTFTFSNLLPAYFIARNPNVRILLISDTSSQAEAITRGVEGILMMDRFKYFYGNVRPDDPSNKWTHTEFIVKRTDRTIKDATFFACGNEAKILGRRSDVIILDDPISPDGVNTKNQRDRTWRWFTQEVVNTLDGVGKIIVVGTTHHYDDLYHRLLKKKTYKRLRQKAIIDDENKITLWPEKWPYDKLMERKEEIGEEAFSKRFQNVVVTEGNRLFDPKQIFACRNSAVSLKKNRADIKLNVAFDIYQGIDLAIGMSRQAKYFVITTWLIDEDGNRYLIDLFRDRLSYPDQKEVIKMKYYQYLPKIVVVENNAYQQALIDDLTYTAPGIPIRGIRTGFNKQNLSEGIPVLSNLITQKKLILPYKTDEDKAVSDLLIDELITYPKGVTSDIIMSWWFVEQIYRRGNAKIGYYPGNTIRTNRWARV